MRAIEFIPLRGINTTIIKECTKMKCKSVFESNERPYVCVHVKKGKCEITASSSYEAAKKAAEKWKLKNTSGIDAYLADVEHKTSSLNESFDDEDDEVNSPDREKVPHILIQLKKALDVNGNKPIVFKDGSRAKVALKDIQKFVKIYSSLKPDAREKMRAMATDSKDMFYKVIGM